MPSQASGQAAKPSKNQARPPKKGKAVKKAQNVGERVVKFIDKNFNPFD
jgi:hypothetical protein